MRKKIFEALSVICAITMLFSCSQARENDVNLTEQSRVRKEKSDEKKDEKQEKKIDWASVAIADGGGAALGAELSAYSGNPYVVFASAVGIGAYASIAEYDRQKESNATIAMYKDNPLSINSLYPFHTYPEYEPYFYADMPAHKIGLGHNKVVFGVNQIRNRENITDTTEVFFLTADLTEKYIDHHFEQDAWEQIYKKYNEYVIKFGVSVRNQLLDDYFVNFKNLYIDDLQEYTKMMLDKAKCSEDTIAYCGISTTYYSYLLWNTLAPNPFIAQECIAWKADTKCCEYIKENKIIKEIAQQDFEKTQCLLLFPSYIWSENSKALYFYTDKETVKKMDWHISFEEDYESPSLLMNANTIIQHGCYSIEATAVDGIYCIFL